MIRACSLLILSSLIGCGREPSAAVHAELSALRTEVAALRTEVAALRRDLPGLAGAADASIEAIPIAEPQRLRVPAALTPEVAAQLNEISRHARLTPHRDQAGRIDGYRLSGVNPGSALHSYGFRSGDVLHRIAWRPLTDTEDAADLFSSLATASTLEVDLTRRGDPLTLVYVKDGPPHP